MRYKPEFSFTLSSEELEQQLRTAATMGKVRLGEEVLFFPRLTGGSYMSYGDILQAYIRQEEVRAKVCCGVANFDQFYLMLLGRDQKLRKYQLLNLEVGKQALEMIAQRNPQAIIGYQKPANPEPSGSDGG